MRGAMPFTREEGGFTTPAAAVALLLVCSLLFVCLHGYSVGTRSGQIQYVADAGALAADNVVAEFVTAGQVVDAALVSCSLLAIVVYAVSAVAAFIPGGAGVAAQFAEAGSKVLQFRDKMADSAIRGLEQVQKALPALAAVRASACIEANAQASGIGYQGLAVTFPADGVEVKISDDAKIEEAVSDIEAREDEIQSAVVEQQEAREQLDEAKRAGWLADCGSEGRDMQERAEHLAGLSGAANPVYASVDTWTFSVALQRAKGYYAARAAAEPGVSFDGSPELVAESVARKRFYEYALEEVSKGSVGATASGTELPSLKALARNNQQMKQTGLYTERVYPVSRSGGTRTIHAWTGCPRYQQQAPDGSASVQDEDEGRVARCDTCKFSALTLGRVPSASSSIDNGFEYHYRKLVEAATDYRAAALELEKLEGELREHSESIEKDIGAAVAALSGMRYDPQPPGRYGCVCIVYAPEAATGPYPFLGKTDALPARVAVSGATLAADPHSDESDVISDIADGLMPSSVPGSGILHVALGAWGSLLKAYANGAEGLEGAFREVLGAIPVVGTELSSQAAQSFEDALTSAGLAPPDLATYKAVLVNSSHILERDGGAAASALLDAKRSAEAYGAASVGDLQVLYDQLGEFPLLDGALTEKGLVLAELPFSFFGFGLSDSAITVPAPADLAALYGALRSGGLAVDGKG